MYGHTKVKFKYWHIRNLSKYRFCHIILTQQITNKPGFNILKLTPISQFQNILHINVTDKKNQSCLRQITAATLANGAFFFCPITF